MWPTIVIHRPNRTFRSDYDCSDRDRRMPGGPRVACHVAIQRGSPQCSFLTRAFNPNRNGGLKNIFQTFSMAAWHVASRGHWRRGAVIETSVRWCIVSNSALPDALSFGVPRASIPINMELIPKKRISLSLSFRNCLLSFLCSTILVPSNGYCLCVAAFLLQRFSSIDLSYCL